MDMDNPETVADGDWVFVEQGNLAMFLSYMFPRIKARFVLVTTGSHILVWDHPTSWTGRYVPAEMQSALESPSVLLWITKNAFVEHPKVMAVPIGVFPPTLKEFARELVRERARTQDALISLPCCRNGSFRKAVFANPEPLLSADQAAKKKEENKRR
jgi:hypothetical protein